jgi:hypothetical protein
MAMNMRNWLIWIGIFVGLSALGTSVGLLYPTVLGSFRAPPSAIILSADPACNPLGRSCAARDATMVVSLALPDAIKPLSPFPVQVHLAGKRAASVEKVAVSFTMQDMNMGFNRFELHRREGEIWQGEALLPICSMGRRDWRVTVEIAGDPPYAGEFHLLTGP